MDIVTIRNLTKAYPGFTLDLVGRIISSAGE